MRDIRDFFHIPESKIEVVYQGCDPIFGQAVQEDVKSSVREKYQINGPYILYVGSIEERKNLLLLVKALKALKEDISVIAIGKHTPYTDTLNGPLYQAETDRIYAPNVSSCRYYQLFWIEGSMPTNYEIYSTGSDYSISYSALMREAKQLQEKLANKK